MVKIIDLYDLEVTNWHNMFSLFKSCDKSIFHESAIEGTWAPEKILRHLIDVLININNNTLDTEKLESEIGINYKENPDEKISLEEIKKEFQRINNVIRPGMEKITEEKELETVKLYGRENPRGPYLSYLFTHNQKHFGQIIWILKRATNWSFQDIHDILNKEKKKNE
ncbi:MAG: DinB family protein [Asgard group archaeon]|nr:DinB family protein [Asgard group archaeon]